MYVWIQPVVYNDNKTYRQGCGQLLDVIHILVECTARAQLQAELKVGGSIREVLSNYRYAEKTALKLIKPLRLCDAI